MSKPPLALRELMTAVDAGRAVDTSIASAPRRPVIHGGRKSAPVVVDTSSSDASFEFSAAVSYSSASPASMVFSDGQLRAHQFPAVRSSADSSQAASPARMRTSSSTGSYAAKKAGVTGSKKRVSFATDGADKAAAKGGAGQSKKSGGLLGCMGSACGPSRKEVVEPAARTANRKVVAV